MHKVSCYVQQFIETEVVFSSREVKIPSSISQTVPSQTVKYISIQMAYLYLSLHIKLFRKHLKIEKFEKLHPFIF